MSLPSLGRLPAVEFLRPFVWLFMQSLHKVRFVGWERVPQEIGPEGLILVSNHASLLDPIITQGLFTAAVRWMTDRTQMPAAANWFWQRVRAIPVDFGPRDSEAFAEAIAHVRSGGLLGVFPEGGLPRPPNEIRPFLPGVGALVARTGAPVLLLWINGGPRAPGLLDSLFLRTNITITVIGVVKFEGDEARDVRAITERLRHEIAQASGWPLNDEPMSHLRRQRRKAQRAAQRAASRGSNSPA